MEYKQYKKIITSLKDAVPPQDLEVRILRKISFFELKKKIAFFGAFSVFGALSISETLKLLSSLKASNFSYYMSLLSSDLSSLLVYWKQFSLLIIESLPLVDIAFLSIVVFFMFWSLRHIASGIRLQNFAKIKNA